MHLLLVVPVGPAIVALAAINQAVEIVADGVFVSDGTDPVLVGIDSARMGLTHTFTNYIISLLLY